jgi:hypothetical protein
LPSSEIASYLHEHPETARALLSESQDKRMAVGGLTEEWARLDEAKKDELRDIIRNLRQLGIGTR